MPKRLPTTVWLMVLSVILLVGAFQWGFAEAAARAGARRQTAIVQAIDHTSAAVVSVSAWRGRGYSRGAGSGVIVHPAGFVVTNSHVISGATRVTVKLFRQKDNLNTRVVANDPRADLALLQIEGGQRWPYVSLAPSQEVILGETAIAIGNPRGLGDSITVGVVSAMRRSAKVSNGGTMRNLIQTDASINTGNSGGPLINLDGELIGINTSILPSAQGIAFAIPADGVAEMVTGVLGHTAPRKPLPALVEPALPLRAPDPRSVASVRPPRRAPVVPAPVPADDEEDDLELVPLRPTDLGLAVEDDGCRLVVRRVKPGSAAAAAGLQEGDVLLDIDDLPAEDMDDVILAFQASFPGRQYAMRVRRLASEKRLLLTAPR